MMGVQGWREGAGEGEVNIQEGEIGLEGKKGRGMMGEGVIKSEDWGGGNEKYWRLGIYGKKRNIGI